jgi:mono/diheme cytochrome c family protein
MTSFRKVQASIQLLRGSNPTRLCLGLATVGLLSGALLLAHPQAAAQSTQTAAKPPSAPNGNAQRGKTIYTRVGCYECHAWDGQSGGGTGPKLGPNPLPFAAFTLQLRTPRNVMPPYTVKVLSDSDVADIYAFVQSLPQPPKLESIPLLK